MKKILVIFSSSILAMDISQIESTPVPPEAHQKLMQFYSSLSGYANNYILFKDGSKLLAGRWYQK